MIVRSRFLGERLQIYTFIGEGGVGRGREKRLDFHLRREEVADVEQLGTAGTSI